MSSVWVPRPLRLLVVRRGRHRCAYCLTAETVSAIPMQVDHIVPSTLRGPTDEANLCLACTSCNRFKGERVDYADPSTGERVRLFNPNAQHWREHFRWSDDGLHILGITPCGQATVQVLQMNNPVVVGARSLWVQAGWWPPED